MGIFNRAMDTFAKKAESPRLKMRCCMLGARGVGKTSVITSMYSSQSEAVSGTNLFLLADDDTRQKLGVKKQELTNIFRGIHSKNEIICEGGLPPTSGVNTFDFIYGMNSEKINIDLEIRDYPGEYLWGEPEEVAAFIGEADAVMIAVDTPCMMEADGRYNEGKNRPDLITEFLKNNLSAQFEKLVLFVPLKCEKYFQEGRIDEVSDKVTEIYAELIAHLRTQRNTASEKKNICCAITPIQTLGDVSFDSFTTDGEGTVEEIRDRAGRVLPRQINYHYTTSDPRFSPKYCEQPLCFLLAFVAKQYERTRVSQEKRGFFDKLREMLRLVPNIEQFQIEMAKLGRRKMDGVQGYRILFGKGKL